MRRTGAVLLMSAILTNCAPQTAALPAPPADAEPVGLSGPDEMRLRQAVTDLRQALDQGKSLDISQYRLGAGAGWPQVAAHYQQALAAGWTRDPTFAENRAGYRAIAWRASGGGLFVAAWLDPAGARRDGVLVTGAVKPD